MKYNLKTPVLDYEGKPMTQPAEQEPGWQPRPGEKPKTEGVNFRHVINAALNRDDPTKPLTPEDKGRIYQISIKIWRSYKADLTMPDCEFIRTRAASVLDPLLVGRLGEFLEGEDPEVPVEDDDDDKETPDETAKKAKEKVAK